ncbi:M23 family metallopeptidase [Leucobacter sp. W1478]|uniref:M23 family metallopeptidase n=1 Tax=Leucobacter sp. W1478 TaxID=3439065 RepID=UPI003F2EDCCE
MISSVFPLFASSDYGTTAAAAVQDQRLILDDVTSDPGITAIDALAAVEVSEVVPVQASNEQGLFDVSLLENSKVRYPFDQEVPLTDPFGYRTAPVEQFHDAQDFAASGGTPIRAIASGQVVEAGFSNDGCGFGLKLQHRVDNQTLTSRYCHMEANSHSYQVGDTVMIGDQAGRVGNTGMSFGSHLHLALRLNGEPIDPMPYLAEKSAS